MEVSALCFRLIINVLLLLVGEDQLCCYAEKAEAASLRVDPNRLQFFEYDSISFHCEGLGDVSEWTVMRRTMGVDTVCSARWETSRGPCFIHNSFPSDSGGYWCEAAGGRSSVVNITVTAGDVILESPAVPLMEGDNVTLRCRSKMTSSALQADFYKEDVLVSTSSSGETTIYRVSKSNEGLYKCSIAEFGQSTQSWMTIEVVHIPRDTCPSSDHFIHVVLVLRTVFTIVLVALLLLLLGLLHCGKLTVRHNQ